MSATGLAVGSGASHGQLEHVMAGRLHLSLTPTRSSIRSIHLRASLMPGLSRVPATDFG